MAQEKDQKNTISEQEEKILKFWQKNKIFEKSLEQRKGGEEFVFYDGPPFATGTPHYGHILASIIKDVIPRFQTMRGRFVPRAWGWDCHGLPLENIIEAELGLQHKKDIETYGIAKFNKAAEEAVLRYADDWKRIIPRIGRWVDMENDYRTMDSAYTESVWWVFKTLYEKKLIYEGHKPMHLCPRCETTLANFEVSQGYKDITDISITVKFELEDEPDTFVLAWTTTPWTLPGNTALAVNSKTIYAKCRVRNTQVSGKYYIVAKERIQDVFSNGEDYEIVEEFPGEKLAEKKYKPLFDYYAADKNLEHRENGWKMYTGNFVTAEEGTGIVHIAPAFGEDDMRLGKEHNLPFIQHVARDGAFMPEVTDFAGLLVKPKGDHQKTDIEIIKLLARRDALFSKKKITHSYPFCWRCETPLLNYAAVSWFVHVSRIRERLQKTAREITWAPPHIKEGRFGKGLETAPDWAISRTRFWGAPLPVWKCETCEETRIVGTREDLETHRVGKPNTFILMRHGERQDIPKEKDMISEYGSIVISSRPDVNIHLSKHGKEEVRKRAEEIRTSGGADILVASDFIRTRETAEILGEVLGITPTYDKRLRELHHGEEFEGRTVEEYWNYFKSQKERFSTTPPGGETLREVRARMMNFARAHDARSEGKRILIVSHGDPLWMLESALRNATEDEALSARAQYIKQGEFRALHMRNYPYDEQGRLNMHRPYSDAIILKCACGGAMKRIPEVFDCWFESGSMPYGSQRYRGESPLRLPADFIAEGLDQTRGWFYALHVLAGALFEKPAYKNVVVNGIILAEDGEKMSKRLKNYPDPLDVVGTYGADALRLYLLSSPAVYAEDLNFSENGVDEVYKKVIVRLQNVLMFYKQHAPDNPEELKCGDSLHVLDKFILYELQKTQNYSKKALMAYRLDRAARAFAEFVDVFSTIYLQYSRDRFKKAHSGYKQAIGCFRYALEQCSKIMAPLAPFLAEDIYQSARAGNTNVSVHLENWPEPESRFAEYADAHNDVQAAGAIIETILRLRSIAGIPVRQPLASATVAHAPKNEEAREIIRIRTNIERLEDGTENTLNTAVTPELREKGIIRAFIRGVQNARKEEGLTPADRIVLYVHAEGEVKNIVEKYASEIIHAVGADSLLHSAEQGAHAISVGAETVTIDITP